MGHYWVIGVFLLTTAAVLVSADTIFFSNSNQQQQTRSSVLQDGPFTPPSGGPIVALLAQGLPIGPPNGPPRGLPPSSDPFVVKSGVQQLIEQKRQQQLQRQPSPETEVADPPQQVSASKKEGSKTFSIPKAILSFALDVGRCRNPDSAASSADCSANTVFSPLSIASTLTMLLMGSSGSSYTQLRTALGYHNDASDADINTAYRFLMERMKKLDVEAGSSILLSVVNGLFSQKQSGFINDYLIKAKDYYLSEVAEMDFSQNTFTAANAINKWVSDKTRGKINNVLSNLPPDTQLVVANAVYFNANWADPFSPDVTRKADFYVSPTETLSVPTMFQHADVAYVENSELGCKMIGIPYKGEELGMFVLVPKEKEEGLAGLNKLESKLSVDVLESLFSQLETKTVSIQLPKFRIQQSLQLKTALRGLGVTDLFSSGSADLTRMMTKKGAALDNIVHQTFIEVTESGTEAAAATIVSLSRDGPSKSFAANQPFLFLIRDIPSKSILFWGRVVRPEAGRSSSYKS